MKLQILSVPDCPNVATLQQRLAAVLAGRENVAVTTEVIDTPEQAVALGMNGSPTLLIDGVDPFAEQGQTPSVSCRLYRDETGNPTGAPSVTQLRAALGVPGTPPSAATVAPAALVEEDCCSPAENAADASAEGLRVWRARTASTDPAARAVHQVILGRSPPPGEPPADAALQRVAPASATAGPILARLHDSDVIRLNPAEAIGVAYPLSAVPTRHRVRLASGVEVRAMCAIDAHGHQVFRW